MEGRLRCLEKKRGKATARNNDKIHDCCCCSSSFSPSLLIIIVCVSFSLLWCLWSFSAFLGYEQSETARARARDDTCFDGRSDVDGGGDVIFVHLTGSRQADQESELAEKRETLDSCCAPNLMTAEKLCASEEAPQRCCPS